jgi:hypothetical protein
MVSVAAAFLISFRATRSLIGGGDPIQLGPILKLETRHSKRMPHKRSPDSATTC